ncbi:hypothetical protein POJ06DRAFT_260169 [Lipomyces tetrasporus]|uniref:UspA domain-containing protein n=1 Tax=Lipomyces tetrasporus TaxID=54092 RepID=A0AAD7VR54_9ASCO|nr:uncharacterized protein POJ06DRAFT_260169 [Lipomyces tetrasporus]KAJ8097810.1 hypothetical protein POJ06DRAFT_260169 [Lipomyces tetrasporus]
MSLSFVEPRRASRSRSRSRSRTPIAHHSPSRSALRTSSRRRDSSESGHASRSLSSPPPQKFQKRVGFDTFDNKDATDFSLTLQAKHDGYVYNRLSRTFLCGTDQNEYSEYALEWLLEELIDDGDEIVCLRVVDPGAKISSSDIALQEKLYRDEAYKLLNDIMQKNEEDKKISLVLEFAVGKVQEMIQRMIEIYEPAVLIVGTRGKSLNGFQGLLPGSISKYCLQHSPVPVIVVRPGEKRLKKKEKRLADPSRRTYMDIVENSKSSSTLSLTKSTHETSSRSTRSSLDLPGSDSPVSKDNLDRLSRVKSDPRDADNVSEKLGSLSLFSSLKNKGHRSVSPGTTSRLVLSSALGAALAASAAGHQNAKVPNPEIIIHEADADDDDAANEDTADQDTAR